MYIIDRLEEEYAICENENEDICKIYKSLIQEEPREGDILIKKGDVYIIDKEETIKRRKMIKNKMKNIFE